MSMTKAISRIPTKRSPKRTGDALEETTPDDLVDEDQSIAETTDQVDFDSLTCAALGASCTEDESCCEGRCIEGSCSNCLNIGVSCSEGSDCCSGECAANEDGSMVCQYPACVEDGDPCEAAADCCSLACNDGLCGGGSCLSTGEECTDDADCCTNICEAGTCGQSQGLCSVAGESCTSDGACCSLSCSGEAGDMRCDAGDVCRAVGEVCEYDEDCCLPICEGGFCQPAPDTSGQLACGVVGEPCDTNHDCCSFACVANADGFKACRATGGCASFGELCTADSDCCNQEGRCNDETEVGECTLFPDRTIGRCSELKGGLPAGHTCEDGFNPGSQCCGGAGYCIETASGISKCFGDLGCDPLTDPSCCIPTGESCQFTEQCCEGLCAADLDGQPGLQPRQCHRLHPGRGRLYFRRRLLPWRVQTPLAFVAQKGVLSSRASAQKTPTVVHRAIVMRVCARAALKTAQPVRRTAIVVRVIATARLAFVTS